MSGDDITWFTIGDDSTWTTMTASTPAVATASHPNAPEIMVPYGIIALTLACVLLVMGLRNLRSNGAAQPQEPLAQKLARAPDSYRNDESSEDEFLNSQKR